MSPLVATDLFVESYVAAYKRKWATNFDFNEAPNKLAIRHGNWRSSPSEFTSVWKARQFADELGVPYGFFCDHAIEVLLRRGYARPPRPNQLYAAKSRQDIEKRVLEAWREHCSDVDFMISKLPQYHLDHVHNHPSQNAHQDWVVEQIHLRNMKISVIRKACFEEGVLPVSRALFEFGPVRMERAREEALMFNKPSSPSSVDTHELRPSCFGILHAYATTEATCEDCAFGRHCKSVTEKLAKHVISRSGIDDPILARKRLMTKKRVSRHRAQKKTATGDMTT
jgi:hypothetical protein